MTNSSTEVQRCEVDGRMGTTHYFAPRRRSGHVEHLGRCRHTAGLTAGYVRECFGMDYRMNQRAGRVSVLLGTCSGRRLLVSEAGYLLPVGCSQLYAAMLRGCWTLPLPGYPVYPVGEGDYTIIYDYNDTEATYKEDFPRGRPGSARSKSIGTLYGFGEFHALRWPERCRPPQAEFPWCRARVRANSTAQTRREFSLFYVLFWYFALGSLVCTRGVVTPFPAGGRGWGKPPRHSPRHRNRQLATTN